MVFEVRDLWPEAAIAVGALRNPVMIAAARWLESFAYRNSASIVALVERLKDGVVRRGYPAANVYVIPNGCDLDLFAVDADERQAFRLEKTMAARPVSHRLRQHDRAGERSRVPRPTRREPGEARP